MPRVGGIYTLPVGNPVTTGTTITSNWANTTLTDIGTTLTNSIATDGQTSMVANLPMGNNKITGLANGTASTDAVAFGQLAVLLPTGIITMWSGSIANIPTGWLICDGTNGTPDLRSRFIVGAGSTYAVNATGGSADAIVVAHTHTGTTVGTSNGHTHGISDPGHSHGPLGLMDINGGGGNFAGGAQLFGTTATNSAFTGITGTQGQSADHTHGFTTGSTGSSGTNANLPPYLALAYIMKA
jgi:hypothetical protein